MLQNLSEWTRAWQMFRRSWVWFIAHWLMMNIFSTSTGCCERTSVRIPSSSLRSVTNVSCNFVRIYALSTGSNPVKSSKMYLVVESFGAGKLPVSRVHLAQICRDFWYVSIIAISPVASSQPTPSFRFLLVIPTSFTGLFLSILCPEHHCLHDCVCLHFLRTFDLRAATG